MEKGGYCRSHGLDHGINPKYCDAKGCTNDAKGGGKCKKYGGKTKEYFCKFEGGCHLHVYLFGLCWTHHNVKNISNDDNDTFFEAQTRFLINHYSTGYYLDRLFEVYCPWVKCHALIY